jgi:hypothetical protein
MLHWKKNPGSPKPEKKNKILTYISSLAKHLFIVLVLFNCGDVKIGNLSNPEDTINSDEILNLIYSSPANDKINVPKNTDIILGFNKDLDILTVNDSNITLAVKDTGESVTIFPIYNPLSRTVTVTTAVNLERDTDYKLTVTLGLRDTGGEPMMTMRFVYFKTGNQSDDNAPEVIATYPADGETAPYKTAVVVEFSEDMDPSLVELSGLAVTRDADSSFVIGATVYFANIRSAIFITDDSAFQQDESYTVTVDPLQILEDLSGNSLNSSDMNTFTFTTNVTQPPVAKVPENIFGRNNGLVTLNGAHSYDPDGDEITYLWTQDPGNPETLTFSQNESESADTTVVRPTLDGIYLFELVVNDGTYSSTPDVLEVNVGITPILTTPEDGMTIVSLEGQTSPRLDWTFSFTQPASFNIVVDNNSDFSSPIINENLEDTYFYFPIEYINTYQTIPLYWKVKAFDTYGNSTEYSETRSFMIITDAPSGRSFIWEGNVTVSKPCGDCIFYEISASQTEAVFTITWTAEPGIDDNYYFRVFDHKNYYYAVDTGTTYQDNFYNLSLPLGKYTVYLKVQNAAGWSEWLIAYVYVIEEILPPPELSLPENGSEVIWPYYSSELFAWSNTCSEGVCGAGKFKISLKVHNSDCSTEGKSYTIKSSSYSSLYALYPPNWIYNVWDLHQFGFSIWSNNWEPSNLITCINVGDTMSWKVKYFDPWGRSSNYSETWYFDINVIMDYIVHQN